MIQITRFQFYWILAAIYMISMIVDWEIYLAERHLEHGINTQITFGGRMKYLTFINLVGILSLHTSALMQNNL